jgi:hypothetical protein
MITAVCTLFERDYHHGVAALVNSLLRSGFSGTVYAGYRGALPDWAASARPTDVGTWGGCHVLSVSRDCDIAFVPLQTAAHFTNFKPDFMLDLFADRALRIDGLFYLDPDICVAQSWGYLVDWLSCGVALCEDINSPIERDHPRRVGWRRHFGTCGAKLEFRTAAYVNGGCIGVTRENVRFLANWQFLSQRMAETIGGLGAAAIEGGAEFRESGFAGCFDKSDQDALNASIEMSSGFDLSILPRTAMGFDAGATVLPHALGARKPWRRRYVREALAAALPPTTADKAFWANADGPLRSMSRGRVSRTRRALRVASALGRFYRRR